MRKLGILLIPGLTLLSGCAGTMSDPIPSHQAAIATCKALAGPAAEGIQPPKLVEKGKTWRGIVLGSGGYACVKATVTPEGRLTEPEILKTDSKTFADAFVKSLSGYVYQPARKDGAAIAAQIVVTGWWSDDNLDPGISDDPVVIKPN
jgi:hypothetical protein